MSHLSKLFYFLTPLSQNFTMLHFEANHITIGYLVTELWLNHLTMLKTIWNISQKQHPRHPTHSSWSCHIWESALWIFEWSFNNRYHLSFSFSTDSFVNSQEWTLSRTVPELKLVGLSVYLWHITTKGTVCRSGFFLEIWS